MLVQVPVVNTFSKISKNTVKALAGILGDSQQRFGSSGCAHDYRLSPQGRRAQVLLLALQLSRPPVRPLPVRFTAITPETAASDPACAAGAL